MHDTLLIAPRAVAPIFTATLAVLCLLGSTPVPAAELLPCQAQGWRYQQVTPGEALETVFMQPAFDDAAWATGQAAFGSVQIGCGVQSTDHTSWAINSAMLLRKMFAADPAAPVTARFAVDDDASVWVNGQLIMSVTHDGCPNLDDWSLTVPPGVVHLGANLVAVRALDPVASASSTCASRANCRQRFPCTRARGARSSRRTGRRAMTAACKGRER